MEERNGKGKAKAQELTNVVATPSSLECHPVATLSSLDVFMCHHCSEFFGKHVYKCENNHLMCQWCYNKKKGMCGKCDDPIGTERYLWMESIMAKAHVYCRYKKDGCSKRLTMPEKRMHEYGCGYGPFVMCQNCMHEVAAAGQEAAAFDDALGREPAHGGAPLGVPGGGPASCSPEFPKSG